MVNIIIPCYNCRATIKDTLNSLVAQTEKKFYVTIVDDCSTEPFDDIVDSFTDKLHIFKLKTKTNGGPGAARQLGIDKSDRIMFDYLMFVDADDVLNPRAVQVLYKEAKVNNADVVSSSILAEKGKIASGILDWTENQTWCHGKIYSNNFLKALNIRFYEDVLYSEDASFNLICRRMSSRYFHIDEVTYIWRDNSNSLTRGSENFKLKNAFYFVCSIAKANLFLAENKVKFNYMLDIVQLYKYYNEIAYVNPDLCEKTIPYINALLSNNFLIEQVKENYKSKKFNAYEFSPFIWIGKEKYLPRIGFYEWLKIINSEKFNNEIKELFYE